MLLPPFHIKQFVKKLNPEIYAFKHIQKLLSKLSEAKIKAEVFSGTPIMRTIKSDSFSEKRSAVDRRA